MLELGAVGDMQVDFDQRVPFVDQAQHRLHFRRVGFHVVAVEVVALGGGAPAHFLRSALVGAIPGAEALVAVHAEHRHEHPDLLVQHAFRGLAFEDFAQGEEARILAVDFAGVDAALDQHHGQTALARRRRRRARRWWKRPAPSSAGLRARCRNRCSAPTSDKPWRRNRTARSLRRSVRSGGSRSARKRCSARHRRHRRGC